MTGGPIHVIVLTKNRPDTLVRCVRQLSLDIDDRLTILDDSCDEVYQLARRLLCQVGTPETFSHWSTVRLFSALAGRLPVDALEWTDRRSGRDIAPLRNLSLLISACQPSALTALIDDDITGFDLCATRCSAARILQSACPALIGACITGIDEEGVIDRYTNALDMFEGCDQKLDLQPDARTLFQTSPPEVPNSPAAVDYVSGGYLVFSLSGEPLIAFPPGYNEDWLWCLELLYHGRAKVFRLPQVVRHEPPAIRSLTADDLSFELLGDLVFDLATRSRTPPLALSALSFAQTITDTIHPSARVSELIRRSRLPRRTHPFLEAGLAILCDLQAQGSLSVDWEAEVHLWKEDAERKQRSFGRVLTAHKEAVESLFYQRTVSYEH